MTLTAVQWPMIAAAVLGILAQLLIAYLSRRQITKQLDIQQLVSHRSTASFVADKRQKWIDELRTDMAFHLASSQEIVWKWSAMRSRTALRVQNEAKDDPIKADKILQDAADAFAPENGARDREHHERHIRIMFRLNPKKNLHIKLRQCLEDIRKVQRKTQGSKSQADADTLITETIRLIDQAQEHTENILKAEWQRVKQEVAYPEVLMAGIPKPEQTK